jgi:hypothetical protein
LRYLVVERLQVRICDIGPELKGNAMAKVAQKAVEALTVLPVHGLLTDMESRKLAQRIQRYVAKYGMSLITTGFKQYAIRRLEDDVVPTKKAPKKK